MNLYSETRVETVAMANWLERRMEVAEIKIVRSMTGVTRNDRY